MGGLTDATWWWEQGLDDVLGGIAGGIVAWGAVWLTLIGTRRQRETEATELAVARLQAACIEVALGFGVLRNVQGAFNSETVLRMTSELAATVAEARVRVIRRWPQMADELDQLRADIAGDGPGAEADTPKRLVMVASRGQKLTADWLENPTRFSRRRP